MKSMTWACFIFNAHQTLSVSTGRISFLNQDTGIGSFYVPFLRNILKSVCSAVCVWRAMSGLFSESGQPHNERVWLLVADWRSVWLLPAWGEQMALSARGVRSSNINPIGAVDAPRTRVVTVPLHLKRERKVKCFLTVFLTLHWLLLP